MPELVYPIGSKKWRNSWKKLSRLSLIYRTGVPVDTKLTKDELIDLIAKEMRKQQ